MKLKSVAVFSKCVTVKCSLSLLRRQMNCLAFSSVSSCSSTSSNVNSRTFSSTVNAGTRRRVVITGTGKHSYTPVADDSARWRANQKAEIENTKLHEKSVL